jgi:xanthine/uracil permease
MPPTRWRDKALSLAVMVLVIAVVLHIAARLVLAVLPVLVGMGIVAVLLYVGWWMYHMRRSRW